MRTQRILIGNVAEGAPLPPRDEELEHVSEGLLGGQRFINRALDGEGEPAPPINSLFHSLIH